MDDANFEQAANLAREAIADFQDLHYLYDWAGTAYLRMKDYDRAREFLLQGLSKSKKKHPLCRTLGEVEWRCKDMPEALYWWAQTIHGFHASRDRNDHGVCLYLHYVADGLVMSELAQKFLQRADQIRSGEIRLIPAAADSLRSQSRAQGTKSMARVLSELAKHYLAGRRKKSRE